MMELIDVKDLYPEISDNGYTVHGFDQYPAKMIPQLARFGIESVSEEGDSILDPFCGCGTVLVESQVTGRQATGVDLNPLAVLYAKAKSRRYDCTELVSAAEEVLLKAQKSTLPGIDTPEWLNYWFERETLKQLLCIRREINKNYEEGNSCRIPLLYVLAVTVRLVSKADPRSPKPYISKKAREERVGKVFDAYENFRKKMKDYLGRLKVLNEFVDDNRCDNKNRVFEADTANIEYEEMNFGARFDAVVTSPPYSSAQDYYRSSKLEVAVLFPNKIGDFKESSDKILGSKRGSKSEIDIEYEKIPVGANEVKKINKKNKKSAKIVYRYIKSLSSSIKNIYKFLKIDSKACIVVGNSTVRDTVLPVDSWVSSICHNNGLSLSKHFVDEVKDRRVPPSRMQHNSVINKEHVLIFEKYRPTKHK